MSRVYEDIQTVTSCVDEVKTLVYENSKKLTAVKEWVSDNSRVNTFYHDRLFKIVTSASTIASLPVL